MCNHGLLNSKNKIIVLIYNAYMCCLCVSAGTRFCALCGVGLSVKVGYAGATNNYWLRAHHLTGLRSLKKVKRWKRWPRGSGLPIGQVKVFDLHIKYTIILHCLRAITRSEWQAAGAWPKEKNRKLDFYGLPAAGLLWHCNCHSQVVLICILLTLGINHDGCRIGTILQCSLVKSLKFKPYVGWKVPLVH